MSEPKLKVQVLKVQVLEGADNKLDLAKLEDVLKRKLIIPSYQRPYAWKSEDIEEIFQTISNTIKNKEEICFFGSIILSKKENGYGQEKYDIIDGQQRLSSFLMILRVILDHLQYLSEELQSVKAVTEQQIEKKLQLKNKANKLSEIIETVSLKRDGSSLENEESILNFIKNSGCYDSLPKHLDKKVITIYDNDNCPIRYESDVPNSSNESFNSYINKILDFLNFILDKIKFCLICITGKNSEGFAINLFNTLNTTGQPLTAFEVLKSELYTVDPELSKEINNIQSEIIKHYTLERKKIVTHTGKLLLYLALYRGDFNENDTLSDNKFKDQKEYLKKALGEEKKSTAPKLVKDIKTINNFYSKNWLNLNSLPNLLSNDDERVCFQFLSELKHDRVLPMLIRFHENNTELLGKCVKVCTAFSSLWRAYCDGGTSGIDKAYKIASLDIPKDCEIEILNKNLKEKFLNKLQADNIEEAKNKWMQKMKTSTIYKNQKLSKFLLFLAYNQRYFDPGQKLLTRRGINILDIHHWHHLDYKTIEHIIPKSDKTVINHINTLGNLTLLPKKLNSSLGDKPFSKKLELYKQFCENTTNEDKYPYLPIIKHIASYDQFTQEEIEERSEILSEFIWQTLAEDWLGWNN